MTTYNRRKEERRKKRAVRKSSAWYRIQAKTRAVQMYRALEKVRKNARLFQNGNETDRISHKRRVRRAEPQVNRREKDSA